MKGEKIVVVNPDLNEASDDVEPGHVSERLENPNAARLANDEMIDVTDLPIGSKLDYSIYDIDKNLLLNNDIIVTETIVNGLLRRGITTVIMRYDEAVSPAPPEVQQETGKLKEKPDKLFYNSLDESDSPANVSRETREAALNSLESILHIVAENEPFNICELQDSCECIINEIVSGDIVHPSIVDLYLTDSSIGHHSVNVIVTFAHICSALGMEPGDVKEYALAAVLHDIGRVILKKVTLIDGKYESVKGRAIKEKLSQLKKQKGVEIDKLHAEVAYKYLRNIGGIPDVVLNAVRNHHERIDGKGFPRGLMGNEITEMEQVLAIADYYEVITWNQSNEMKAGQAQAIKNIIQQSGRMADCQIIAAFLNSIGHFPPGSWVELSSSETALVIQATAFKPRSPVVRVYFDKTGTSLDEPIQLDLSEPGMPHIVKHVDM
jgi:HD-GYP domain-containing protein (c-di-GMP phosphodiesterase class II)